MEIIHIFLIHELCNLWIDASLTSLLLRRSNSLLQPSIESLRNINKNGILDDLLGHGHVMDIRKRD